MQKDELKKVAKLAAIAVDDSDLENLTADVTNILNLVEQMQQVDTANVRPMAHPQDAVQNLRADIVNPNNIREAAQKIAPLTQKGLYLVPQVIE